MATRLPGTQHSWEVRCSRCGGTRYVHEKTTDPEAPYLCIRCRAVRRKGNVIDPLPTDTKREVGRDSRAKQRKRGG